MRSRERRGVRPRAGWSRETRTQSRRVAECGRRQMGRGGALGAGTGGCEDPSPGGGGGAARPGPCGAAPRKDAARLGEARGPWKEAAGGARSRFTAPTPPPPGRPLSAGPPPGAGRKPRASLREPPPRPRPAPPPAAGWGSAGRGARGGARAELRPLRTCRARAPASTGRS